MFHVSIKLTLFRNCIVHIFIWILAISLREAGKLLESKVYDTLQLQVGYYEACCWVFPSFWFIWLGFFYCLVLSNFRSLLDFGLRWLIISFKIWDLLPGFCTRPTDLCQVTICLLWIRLKIFNYDERYFDCVVGCSFALRLTSPIPEKYNTAFHSPCIYL